ncbi:hypothetical protein LCGC14_2149780 [marine sediment metagenome]|uniref:Uncharacterized protein n=1 Tax=marine sediment metagenome TaxID=412755 RepID=A0A0F9DW15_9ZZZZ
MEFNAKGEFLEERQSDLDVGTGEEDENRGDIAVKDEDSKAKDDDTKGNAEDEGTKAKDDDTKDTKQKGDDEQPDVPYKHYTVTYKRLKEAERENQSLKEAAAKGKGSSQEQTPIATLPDGIPAKPLQADFENYDDFIEALGTWRYDADKRKDADKVGQEAYNKTLEGFDEKMAKAYAEDPEFNEHAYVPKNMLDIFVDSPDPVGLAVWFGANRDEGERIAALPSIIAQSRAVATIEASLKEPPKKTDSNAPGGINEIGNRGKVEKDLFSGNLSTADFIAARNKEQYGSADP